MIKGGLTKLFLVLMVLVISILFIFASTVGWGNFNKAEQEAGKITGNVVEEVNLLPFSTYKESKNISVNETNLILRDIKKFREDLPEEVINSSDNFIESFVDKKDLNNNFKFRKGLIFYDSGEDLLRYFVVYSFQINYYRENGKRTRVVYPFRIELDETGNVIDKIQPKEKYNNLKLTEI